MRKLLVAAMMLVLATPAFAAIQNVKVSGDITTSWLYDQSLDLGATNPFTGTPAAQKHQNVFITQTRLRVDADLSDNVSTTVGLINERAWNAEGSTYSSDGSVYYATNPDLLDTNVQLYLASITLREFLYSPLTLQIGRQVFAFGNGLILGDGGPINGASGNLAGIFGDINERTAYDGVIATLDYKPLTISLIYFKNGQNLDSIAGNFVSNPKQSSDVYGYNANYQLNDAWSTVVEQYLFTRINGSGFGDIGPSIGGTGGDTMFGPDEGKGNTLYVPGLRASTNPTKNLNVQGEIAWELGNQDVQTLGGDEAEHRDAMLAQLMATYTVPVMTKYKPTVNASWTYASGDKDSAANYITDPVKSAKWFTAWDEFNTIQGAGTIYRELFPLSNENIISFGASVSPLDDVTASVQWTGLWATNHFGLNNPIPLLQPNGTGGYSVVPGTNNAYWLGNETDINLTYNYTEDVTFGLSIGWFVPGDVFGNATSGTVSVGLLHDTASQAIANVGVKF